MAILAMSSHGQDARATSKCFTVGITQESRLLGPKSAENTNTLHGMYGIEILREIEYQHREGERCSQAYRN